MVHGNWTHNTLMQLVLRGKCQGQDIVSIHHFEAPGATEATLTDDGLAQTWAASVATDWITNRRAAWLLIQPTDYTLTNVVAQVLERPATYEHKLTETENPMASAGTGAAGSASIASSPLIRWRTPNAGKHHRGRTYVGPVINGQAINGQLVALAITNIGTYASGTLTRYSGVSPAGNALLTVYSKPLDAGKQQWTVRVAHVLTVRANPDYAGDSTNITSAFVDPIVRTQRRREIGVGS